MYKLQFNLNQKFLNVYPLGSSCFYITGSYKVIIQANSVVGNANFQSWINGASNGIGIMTVDIPSRGLFFFSTFDIYKNGIFRHTAFGLSGGLLSETRSIEFGAINFRYVSRNNILCELMAYILRPNDPGNIPFYQNYVLTDPNIVTNALKQGDINSVFRVGELTIRNPVDNTKIGTNFFENYATPENNKGIGISVYICENQILYSFLSLTYTPSLQDPSSTVSIKAITPAGQRYLKNFIQGVDQTTLNGNNYFETITGISRDIPSKNQTIVDCILSDLKVQIFKLQPNEPKAVIRLGFYTIINNEIDRIPLGTVDFQSYVTTNQKAIGTVVIRFNNKKGCIFGVYSTEFDSPVVSEPNAAQVSFTAGQGDFAQLFNGYADLESIPSSTDRKAKIVYTVIAK